MNQFIDECFSVLSKTLGEGVTAERVFKKLRDMCGDGILETFEYRGDRVAVVRKDVIVQVMRCLKEDPTLDLNMLIDLTAVDYLPLERKPRFHVVYHLKSLKKRHRLRIKVPVGEEDLDVPSLTPIWPVANWFEREVWDMFGIRFTGHPNLKRILMYDEFVGHPLRKDYPLNKRQPLIGPGTEKPNTWGQTPLTDPPNIKPG